MMQESTQERPLVTFALFAYNQEKYIREAIEGAFAQTYEPLEIILSDDCSTDRTFEIMQEMVADYRGPHIVKVSSSIRNRGTLKHVLDVANMCHGKYLVVQAGDDISKCCRTEIAIKALEESDKDVLVSGSDIFVEHPKNVVSSKNAPLPIHDQFLKGEALISQIHGATAVYRKDFLLGVPVPDTNILLEDYYFQLFAFWQGKEVLSIDDRLVLHRVHDSNVGPNSKLIHDIDPLSRERSLSSHYSRMHDVLADILSNWRQYSHYCLPDRASDNGLKSESVRYYLLKSRWWELSLKERVEFFRISRLFSNKRSDAARCLGPTLFSWLMKR